MGVTLYEDRPVEHIVLWVSDSSKGYVETKPIHGSQTPIGEDKEQELRTQYPSLEGGAFFSIDSICNYELIRELSSYGKDLIVLRPLTIKNEISKRILALAEAYSSF